MSKLNIACALSRLLTLLLLAAVGMFANGIAAYAQFVPVGFTSIVSTGSGACIDPSTGVFQQIAPMQTPRVYHSVALLLKDGRVPAAEDIVALLTQI